MNTHPDKRDHPQPFWFWLDLEMTGLDPATDRIIEAGVLVTNRSWEVVESWESPVRQPPEVLQSMNDWCRKQHGDSGLLARLDDGVREDELDAKLVDLTQPWADIPVVLCGNSIGQDRKFVDRYLPGFAARLHYRMLDVSSLKILFTNYGTAGYSKKNSHRALDDIHESIAELKYYLQAIRFF